MPSSNLPCALDENTYANHTPNHHGLVAVKAMILIGLALCSGPCT
ncbi:MAG: hypothetical protein NTX45_07280 [Proteobacteria bacterium]|nr:hypothetical protein [Pseudomonadota bacterium]